MDLLALFRGSPERQIRRARKKVKEPHGDASVRINAARRLCEIGSEEALGALLERFTISSSPSRQDEEEKEDVLSWLVQFGERSVPPITAFLKRERQVYWPTRALKEILSSDELVRKVDDILTYHWENPPASADPIAQLIRFAHSLESTQLEATIRKYLEHEDDDVCLSALEYLFQKSEEESREAVLQCYLNCEDRPRVRAAILERFSEKGWSVRGFRPRIEETLPERYTLTRDGVIKTMGTHP